MPRKADGGQGDSAPIPLEIRRKNGKIWSHVRSIWLEETPEERVRQEYLKVVVEEYGYALPQIDEEREVTGKRGTGNARADFVIWASEQDKLDQKNPLIIIETKSDNVTIQPSDYSQGENYARLTGAKFVVTHNSRETRFWRVVHDHMPKTVEEIEGIPHAVSGSSRSSNLRFMGNEDSNMPNGCQTHRLTWLHLSA
jgi:type I restriction enzyme M protein